VTTEDLEKASQVAGGIPASIGPSLAAMLHAASRMAEEYPELAEDHDRLDCEDYTCNLMGSVVTLARAILKEDGGR
jgi:hypothetical protein